MGGVRKGKTSNKSKSSKSSKDGKSKPVKHALGTQDQSNSVPAKERIAYVLPYWETLSHEQQFDLLTLDIDVLHQQANEVSATDHKQLAAEDVEAEDRDADALNVAEVFDVGIARLQEKDTWKIWQWPAGGQIFCDAKSFRQHVREQMDGELRAVLAKNDSHSGEKPSEAALRQRMLDLLEKVQAKLRKLQHDMAHPRRPARGQRLTSHHIRPAGQDAHVELIATTLEALEQEHEFLYRAVVDPIIIFVRERLPLSGETTADDLSYEDLGRIVPEDVACICDWLTGKVDSLSAKIEPGGSKMEEQKEGCDIGDEDLFTLTSRKDKLTINSKWFQQLQEPQTREDDELHKVHGNTDLHSTGLVLDWVYGTVVAPADKARAEAKRPLGSQTPSTQQAYDLLCAALKCQLQWETRAQEARDHLEDMLRSRQKAKQVAEHHVIRPLPASTLIDPPASEAEELPYGIVFEMLKREVLLTRAKFHVLSYKHELGERKRRTLKSRHCKGQPEYHRLKRELEDVKNQPRQLEGMFRGAAEKKQHRAQMVEDHKKEQLEAHFALREHAARLQDIHDQLQRLEIEQARRESETKQLEAWGQSIQRLANRLKSLITPEGAGASAKSSDEADGDSAKPSGEGDGDSAKPSSGAETFDDKIQVDQQQPDGPEMTRAAQDADQASAELHDYFQKDIRRQLYTDEDDRVIFGWIQSEVRSVEQRLENGRAVLQHLEMQLMNVACDDPGATIGTQLVLPMLRERLDAKAHEFAERCAAELRNARVEELLKEEQEAKAAAKAAEARKDLKRQKQAQRRARDQTTLSQADPECHIINASGVAVAPGPEKAAAAAATTSSLTNNTPHAEAPLCDQPAVEVPGKATAAAEADGSTEPQCQANLPAVPLAPAAQGASRPQHSQNPNRPLASAIEAAAFHHAEVSDERLESEGAQPWITLHAKRVTSASPSMSGQTASSSAKAPSSDAPPVPTLRVMHHGPSAVEVATADEHTQQAGTGQMQRRQEPGLGVNTQPNKATWHQQQQHTSLDLSLLLAPESAGVTHHEQWSSSSPQHHLGQQDSSGLDRRSKSVKQSRTSAAAALSGGSTSSRAHDSPGQACAMASMHAAGQPDRPRPMRLQPRAASPLLAHSTVWSTSDSDAHRPASAGQYVERLPASSPQMSLPVGIPSAEGPVTAPEMGISRAGAQDVPHASQVAARMEEALAQFSLAKADLTTSIREAAIWLGHGHALSTTPAQQQQVRDCMRSSKEALQKVGPRAAAVVWSDSKQTPNLAEEDDDACVICLDQPATVTFQPCGHNVTCAVCAMMVTHAEQPCPVCRSPVTSVHG